MAIVINGSGTVTGLAVGGLPDGTVDEGTLATDSVTAAKLEASAITVGDLPAGSVLQVVQGTTSTSVTSTSTTYVDTGLTATITPTSANSKILVVVAQNGGFKGNGNINNGIGAKLLRGATSISSFAAYAGWSYTTTYNYMETIGTTYLDSPATTSATAYKTQFKNMVAAGEVKLQSQSNTSTITLMEVAG